MSHALDILSCLHYLIHNHSVYFIQGHRFDIWEGVGCYAAIPNTILFLCLSSALSIIIGAISAAYCGTIETDTAPFRHNNLNSSFPVSTLRVLYNRRSKFKAVLLKNYRIKFHQYCRLILLSVVEITLTIPLATYILVRNITQVPIYTWKGLVDLHYHFGRIDQYPIDIWTQSPAKRQTEIDEWLIIACAIVFFLLFGLTEEARIRYLSGFNAVAGCIGIPPNTTSVKFTR